MSCWVGMKSVCLLANRMSHDSAVVRVEHELEHGLKTACKAFDVVGTGQNISFGRWGSESIGDVRT